MKRIMLLIGLSLAVLLLQTYATTQGTVEITAELIVEQSLEQLPIPETQVSLLGKQYETNIVIGRIIVNATSRFQLILSSENNGYLVKTDASNTYISRPGTNDKIPYQVTLIEEGGGTLGVEMPPFQERSNLTLINETPINFTLKATGSTTNKIFVIYMSTPQKTNLNNGVYQDRLGVSIADIN